MIEIKLRGRPPQSGDILVFEEGGSIWVARYVYPLESKRLGSRVVIEPYDGGELHEESVQFNVSGRPPVMVS